ncbi:MAG: outer membrane beta-barrel protein [Fibrella sp.]|nr:outer membrane beta-barrel protein [Armatimonadota bacterium]
MRQKISGGFGVMLVAVLILLAGGVARAQEDLGNVPYVPDRLKFALGGLIGEESVPGSSDKQGWFLLTASYDLLRPSPSRFVDFAAYIETARTKNRERLEAGRYRDTSRAVYGAGITMTVRLLPPNPHFGVYALAGAGGYSLERNVNDVYQYIDSNPFGEDTQGEYTDTLESRNRFTFGYKLGGGVRFARGMFLEAAYHNFGRFDDDDYGGFGISFGLRL